MIRNLIAAAIIATTAGYAVAQEAPGRTLTVEVSGLKPAQGVLYVGLANSEQGYRTFQFADGATAQVDGETAIVSFSLPDGDYAMHIFQDLNGDGQPNFDAKGTPTEPLGASNNASLMYGPAQWPEARFSVKGDVKQTIALQTFGS